RDLLKIKLSSEKYTPEDVEDLKSKLTNFYRISQQEASYFIFKGKIKNQAYNKDVEPIKILKKDRTIEDVVEASDQLNLKALSKPVTKYFICFPKVLAENS
ncbi:MAG: phosphohydrolase, partial [Flavobacterium johnsoniae]